jgi:transcriptional regulator with XRE-family HTH domain
MFNGNILKAKMVEKGVSMERLANVLGINTATLYRKIKGISDFSRADIQAIRSTLSLTLDEVDRIFFAL